MNTDPLHRRVWQRYEMSTEELISRCEFAKSEAGKELDQLLRLEATAPREYHPVIVRQIDSLNKEIEEYNATIEDLMAELGAGAPVLEIKESDLVSHRMECE